jgi:hypothetical protein
MLENRLKAFLGQIKSIFDPSIRYLNFHGPFEKLHATPPFAC